MDEHSVSVRDGMVEVSFNDGDRRAIAAVLSRDEAARFAALLAEDDPMRTVVENAVRELDAASQN